MTIWYIWCSFGTFCRFWYHVTKKSGNPASKHGHSGESNLVDEKGIPEARGQCYIINVIIVEFFQFTSKKLAFFLNTNLVIEFRHKIAPFSQKSLNFSLFFRRKYVQNYNFGHGDRWFESRR
jgi:hypothetical protein